MEHKKKIPIRKCVGCGERYEKKALIRILRTPEGKVLLDAAGRMNGRGAYLCRKVSCLEKARKNRGLERSLGIAVPDEIYEELKRGIGELEEK